MILFTIKKIISIFLYPFSISIILLVLGLFYLWFTKKQKTGKVLVSICAAILILMGLRSVSDYISEPLEKIYPKYEKSDIAIKYIVVLGGGYGYDPQLPVISRLSKASIFRLTEGLAVYNENPQAKLIFTGYGGIKQLKPIAEGMAEAAIALGIPKNSIIVEPSPKDTREEAVFVKNIVENAPFVLVTSAMHMKRAVMLFRKLGMNPIPAPSDFSVKRVNSGVMSFPTPGNISKVHAALHEYLGILWGRIRGFI